MQQPTLVFGEHTSSPTMFPVSGRINAQQGNCAESLLGAEDVGVPVFSDEAWATGGRDSEPELESVTQTIQHTSNNPGGANSLAKQIVIEPVYLVHIHTA
jgi:hypothetical protein